MGQIPAPRSSLANRLRLALAAMLLPAAAGLVTFRLSISALEEIRAETVDESTRIEAVRHLLVRPTATPRAGRSCTRSPRWRRRWACG
jgi:hypothetical protein